MPRAVRFDHYGELDVLHVDDVSQPQPGADEVVVEVVATSINPGEAMIRTGALDAQWPATFPSGQGSDFAGRVRTVGTGVTAWHEGDEVIGWTDDRAAQAEFVVVSQDQLTVRPAAVPWDQAATLYVAGCTAYAVVEALRVQAGETVAVAGAAGGVGSIVVQLLRNRDVRVLGIAGAGNADWLSSVGVEPVRHGDGLGHRLRDAAPEGIDGFADLFGGGYVELAVGLGTPADRVVTIIDYAAAETFGARVTGGAEVASAGVLAELAELVADGELTVPIAARFPLEQVREAYALLAQRHTRGKIVLEVAS